MAGRILIVEDEAAIARFVELELQHEGYAVDKAEDGRSGLELALAGIGLLLWAALGLLAEKPPQAGPALTTPLHKPGKV